MELLPPVGWADITTQQASELMAVRLEACIDRGFRKVIVTTASLLVTGFAATIAVVFTR